MRVVAYVRVSTERQAEQGSSIEDQVRQIKDWAKSNGHLLLQIFEEPGFSAFDEAKRPQFGALIDEALSTEHPFDAIVVHSLSRFCRDNVLRAWIKRKLAKANVLVISLTQPLPEDENAAYLVENMFGLIDEFQSRENSKHVIRCQKRNAQAGYFNGSRPPFGYMTLTTDIPARSGFKKKLVICQEEAEIVRKMFSLANEGMDGVDWGVKKIATYLNQQGDLNRGKLWRKQQVQIILKNHIYIGKYTTFRREARTGKVRPQSEWIVVDVPPIIEMSIFERVQSSLEKRQFKHPEAKSTQVKTLLTGLIRCDTCNKGLHLMTGKSGRYRYYRCATKTSSNILACSCPNIPKEELEHAVLNVVANQVLCPGRVTILLQEMRAAILKATGPDLNRLHALQHDAANRQEKITTLYNHVGSGLIELDNSLQEHIRAQQRKLFSVQEEIEVIQKRQQLPLRKFSEVKAEQFADMVRKELLVPGSPHAKAYLRAIVSEIRIRKTDCVIRGSKALLAASISKWIPGTSNVEVPSLVSDWRARRDSNS